MRSFPARRLAGSLAIPGDKSISHRAVILGAMAKGTTLITGLLESEDVHATLGAVRAFGAHARRLSAGHWEIEGANWVSPEQVIDCGNSGTAARLLMGAAAGYTLAATFTGDSSLRRRPMQRIVEPLARLGARFDHSMFLPIRIQGGPLGGIRFESPVPSAQVKSAILLAGLHTKEPVEVLESVPTRDHSEHLLRHFGCDVEIIDTRGGRLVRLGARRNLRGTEVTVPGDPSSAAFPIVAALITRDSEVTVTGVLDSPARNGLLRTLTEMGADIAITNRRKSGGLDVVDVTARSSSLKAVRVPAGRAPAMIDEYPILAVAAAFARGETIMEGLGELRVKESDRLAAILAGLKACGVEARSAGDDLIVAGDQYPPKGGAAVRSEQDHRIAMAFLTLGLGAREPVRIDDAAMISTSFPEFGKLMQSLGAGLEATYPEPGTEDSAISA